MLSEEHDGKTVFGSVIGTVLIVLMTFIVIATGPLIFILGYIINKRAVDVELNKLVMNTGKISGSMPVFWLSSDEKKEYKQKYRELAKVKKIINEAKELRETSGISRNKDGSFSVRSKLGKELKAILEEYEPKQSPLEESIAYLEKLPKQRWQDFDRHLKKSKSFLWTIIVWISLLTLGVISLMLTGQASLPEAFFVFSLMYVEFDPLIFNATEYGGSDLSVYLGTCAGCAYLFFLYIFRKSSLKYTPKPDRVSIDNVDAY